MIQGKLIGIFSLLLATALVAVMGITSCSSSGGDSSDGAPASASAVSIGAMTKGSVIVNGVTFDDTSATVIADDDAQKVLANGMVVKVKGTVNDDGLTGKAEKVEVVNEVSGTITSKGTDTFSVLNQTVLVDGATVFAGGATNLNGLNADDSVEVHGQRDASRTIRATRVEKHAGGVVDEVRGAVSGKTATTFNIGSLPITFGISTAITPTGATFVDGDIVQVHLNGTIATSIKVEDDDVEFEPAEGEEFEVEGFVSSLSSDSFKVNDQQVQTSSSTRFDGGVKGDLVNDMKVEAEGHLANGILVADKVTLKESIRIESTATTDGKADLLGKAVLVTSKTEFSSNLTSTAGIAVGDGLRIRGFVNNDGSSITATRVDKQSPLSNNRSILRGPVKNINASASTFTILGITINASTATARPNDDSGNSTQTMTPESFFTSLTADRTIVKARGTFDAGTNTIAADEIELE
jgi:hypothetical protein